MDFPTVQAALDDLPQTFKRANNPYPQWIDSETTGLYRYTLAADGTLSQANFMNAQYGWLDFWGLLFGIPRNTNEADRTYAARIVYTINTGGGTPNAIILWIQIVWGITVTITENFPAIGYKINFPGSLTTAQITAILSDLIYVRPAGVPINGITVSNIGPFLNTVNFVDAPRITGAYLGGNSTAGALGIPATTNNATPLLPDLYLTDPTLNPNLPTTP